MRCLPVNRVCPWNETDLDGLLLPTSGLAPAGWFGQTGGVELLVARNPDPAGSLPYLLRVPLESPLIPAAVIAGVLTAAAGWLVLAERMVGISPSNVYSATDSPPPTAVL
jgi:hypothetical protein